MARKSEQWGIWEPGHVRLPTMLHTLHQKLLDTGINIYEMDSVKLEYTHRPDVEDSEGGQLPSFTAMKVTYEKEESGS